MARNNEYLQGQAMMRVQYQAVRRKQVECFQKNNEGTRMAAGCHAQVNVRRHAHRRRPLARSRGSEIVAAGIWTPWQTITPVDRPDILLTWHFIAAAVDLPPGKVHFVDRWTIQRSLAYLPRQEFKKSIKKLNDHKCLKYKDWTLFLVCLSLPVDFSLFTIRFNPSSALS